MSYHAQVGLRFRVLVLVLSFGVFVLGLCLEFGVSFLVWVKSLIVLGFSVSECGF